MTKDEALNILKELHDKAPLFEKGALEVFFPEFKESEDERIRKDLISLLNSSINGKKVFSINDTTRKQMIAWLEKQNERPTTINVDKMVDEFEHSKVMSRGIPSLAEVDAYRKGVTDALSKILIREEKDC